MGAHKLLRKLILPLLISALAVGILLSLVRLDLRGCGQMLRSIDGPFVLLLSSCYLIPFLLRSWRLHLLLPRRVPTTRVLGATLLHQFYATFLPLKTGEMSLPMMLKSDRIRRAETIGVLWVARSFDLVAAASLLSASLWVFRGPLPKEVLRLWPVAAVAWGLVAMAGGVVLLGPNLMITILARLGSALTGGIAERLGWVGQRVADLQQAVRDIDAFRMLVATLISLAMWLPMASFGVAICRQFVPQVAWPAALVLSLCLPLLLQLPIHGLLGIGTSQAVIVLLFATVDVPTSEALSLGIVWQLLQTLLLLVVGAVGFFLRPPKFDAAASRRPAAVGVEAEETA